MKPIVAIALISAATIVVTWVAGHRVDRGVTRREQRARHPIETWESEGGALASKSTTGDARVPR